MKKTCFLITALIALMLVSCGAGDKNTLTLNLSKGGKYAQTIVSDMEYSFYVGGNEIKIKASGGADAEYKVNEVLEDSYKMTLRIINMYSSASSMGYDMIIDTRNPKSAEDEVLRQMIEVLTFDIEMAKNGQIKSIKLPDNAKELIKEKIPGAGPEISGMFEQLFSESSLNQLMGFNNIFLPEGEVKVGQTWNNTINNSLAMGVSEMNFIVNSNFTYDGIVNNVHQITSKGTIAYDGGTDNAMFSINMSGSYDSVISLDKKSRMIKSGKATSDVTGTMIDAATGEESPITMKITVTYK